MATINICDDETNIRRLVATHVAALHDKNVAAAMANVDENILSFDLAPPLANRGAATYRRNLEAWFPTWDGPIDYEQANLEVTIGGDVAFTTAYNRLGGAKSGQGTHHLWVRITAGLKRIEGRWRIVHEHVSVPFYMDGSLKAAVDLSPPALRRRQTPHPTRDSLKMDTKVATTPTDTGQMEITGGVAPYLMLDGAIKAADLYLRAFGAEDVSRVPPDDKGRSMHCHVRINGGSVMISDFYPEHGHPAVAPQAFNLHLQVDDFDAWWDRAAAAGLEVALAPHDAFWGDRYGQLRDPFGVNWTIGAHKR
jgi:PhnB protein